MTKNAKVGGASYYLDRLIQQHSKITREMEYIESAS